MHGENDANGPNLSLFNGNVGIEVVVNIAPDLVQNAGLGLKAHSDRPDYRLTHGKMRSAYSRRW
jgi:hypothetical protein